MAADVDELLQQAKTIAVVGCSANKYRTSYNIASYLKENGYRVIPVNPNYDEVLGQECYDSVRDIPGDISVDIVNIFRNSTYTAEMVRDTIKWSREGDRNPLVWTQLDVSSPEAKSLAEEEGLQYVENECIMVRHSRL